MADDKEISNSFRETKLNITKIPKTILKKMPKKRQARKLYSEHKKVARIRGKKQIKFANWLRGMRFLIAKNLDRNYSDRKRERWRKRDKFGEFRRNVFGDCFHSWKFDMIHYNERLQGC